MTAPASIPVVETGAAKKKHAILSPSKADQWMVCPGSIPLSIGIVESESAYASEGTDYHEVAALCLDTDTNAMDYLNQPMLSGALVTEANAKAVQVYIDYVRSLHAAMGGTRLIEEAVPLTQITGEPEAEGTSDAIILAEGPEMAIIDLKFGRGVEVPAERNRQMMLYAIGALDKHTMWEEYKTVRLVIVQPRITSAPSEWCVSIDELRRFKEEAGRIASLPLSRLNDPSLPPLPLVASDKGCRFCKAKGLCPELERAVKSAMTDGFTVIDETNPKNPHVTVTAEGDRLGDMMAYADLAELWIKAVRARVEAELLAGRPVKNYKLVQGKKGNRSWIDPKAVELILRKTFRMKIEDVYDMTVISPTTAEERLKKGSPKRWKQLEPLITQKEGAKSVAHISDKRPALTVEQPEEGFAAITGEGLDLVGDCSDLI